MEGTLFIAPDELGPKWEHVTFGRRNSVKRLFRTLKKRTKVYNNILLEYISLRI